jgi:replicative DNA helicase
MPKNGDLSDYVFAKVPPQAIPLEEAVLGAAMLEKDAFSIIIDIIRPESFYIDAHQLIFKAMLELFEKTIPIDLLTLHDKLTTMGEIEAVGGSSYLAALTSRVASAANIEYHARIIAQKYIQRELIRVSTDIIRDSYEDTTDVFDLLDKAEQGLFAITEQNMNKGYEGMNTLAGKALKMIESLLGRAEGLTGITSGFPALDRVTSGWQRTDLIVIAARPAMGKTSFTLALARNAAMNHTSEKPFPVAFFSLEMSKLQLVQRLISLEAEIPGSSLRGGQLSDDELKRLHLAVEKLSDAPIYIDDSPGLNIFELRAKCRRLKMQHDIQIIIIDYLQLMSGGGDGKSSGNREQEISQISRSLKALAKELNVPVIALSQLSRAVESRGGDKRPQLSDLRESGAIEQDADIVSFIYRPEYYQITEDDEGNSTKEVGEIIIAKHRNGALENVRLKFVGQYAKFMNWDDQLINNVSFEDVFSNQNSLQSNLITKPSRLNQGSIATNDLLAPPSLTADEEVPF